MDNRIRALRKERGWTLADLSEQMGPNGPTAQTIARLETGTRTLTLPWLERFAQAFDVTPQDLLTLAKGPSSPILGVSGSMGIRPVKHPAEIDLSVLASDPVALEFDVARGRFQAGDIVIFDRREDVATTVIDEALVASGDALYFGSLFPGESPGSVDIATPPPTAGLHHLKTVDWAAHAVAVVRRLSPQ